MEGFVVLRLHTESAYKSRNMGFPLTWQRIHIDIWEFVRGHIAVQILRKDSCVDIGPLHLPKENIVMEQGIVYYICVGKMKSHTNVCHGT
jgi:hypothetical protein